MNLYAISAGYAEVLRDVEDADGILEADLEGRLDAAGGALTEKVEAVVAFMRGLELRAQALKVEEKRLAERRKATERHRDRLEAYLQTCMHVAQTSKVAGTLFTVTLKKNPEALHLLVDDDAVPGAWTKTTTKVEVDRAAIKAALLNGMELSFAELTQGESVVIR